MIGVGRIYEHADMRLCDSPSDGLDMGYDDID